MSDEFLNKPWHRMSDDELHKSFDYWKSAVEKASGWASAHAAAKCLEVSVSVLNHRGFKVSNPYPIVDGEPSGVSK